MSIYLKNKAKLKRKQRWKFHATKCFKKKKNKKGGKNNNKQEIGNLINAQRNETLRKQNA